MLETSENTLVIDKHVAPLLFKNVLYNGSGIELELGGIEAHQQNVQREGRGICSPPGEALRIDILLENCGKSRKCLKDKPITSIIISVMTSEGTESREYLGQPEVSASS